MTGDKCNWSGWPDLNWEGNEIGAAETIISVPPLTAASQGQNWALTRTRKRKKKKSGMQRKICKTRKKQGREGGGSERCMEMCRKQPLLKTDPRTISALQLPGKKNHFLHNFNQVKGIEKPEDAAQQSCVL